MPVVAAVARSELSQDAISQRIHETAKTLYEKYQSESPRIPRQLVIHASVSHAPSRVGDSDLPLHASRARWPRSRRADPEVNCDLERLPADLDAIVVLLPSAALRS